MVQNSGVAAGQSPLSALNIAVTPVQATIPGAPNGAAIGVGTDPTAVAIDKADGIAVVANAGEQERDAGEHGAGTIVGGRSPWVRTRRAWPWTICSPNPVALVVNSARKSRPDGDGDRLTRRNETTLGVSIYSGANPPPPYAIGVNPLTHRAIVAYQSASLAMILDVSDAGGTPGLTEVQTIGGSSEQLHGDGRDSRDRDRSEAELGGGHAGRRG